MTVLDPGVNFGFVFVSGTYSSTATSIQLDAGQGLLLKDPAIYGSYNVSWLQYPIKSNIQDDLTKEIVRVTSLVGDTLVVIRGQENTLASDKSSTSAKYVLIVSPTAKLLDDSNNQYDYIQQQFGTQSAALSVIDNTLQVQTSSIIALNSDLQLQSASIHSLQGQLGSQSLATGIFYANAQYPPLLNVQEALDQLLYITPTITSFVNSVGTVEMGSTVTAVSLSWAYNKTMVSASLTDAGNISPAIFSYNFASLSVTSNKIYVLDASDGTNTANASTAINFSYKRYWGTYPSSYISSGSILGLSQEFASTRNQSKTVDGNGEYIFFIYPTIWGSGTFSVNGLLSTAWNQTIQSFTNAQGYTALYNIYVSATIQSGTGIQITIT